MIDIRTINDGETITEPGAYRMSMAHYHSQEVCPGPSVSSTGLRKLALQSPRAFWMEFEGNPHRLPPREPGPALVLGRAAHALILGDEVFRDVFAFVPADAPPRPTATQIRAYERDGKWSDAARDRAEWWEAFDRESAGKTLITADQVETIQHMADSLASNSLAREALTGGLVEISMIYQDRATGIWVKSRPDMLPDNGFDGSDLKTFSPRGSDLVLSAHRAITDHGYHIQMALAALAAEEVFGVSASEFILVFVQTSPPYETIPIRLDEEALYLGKVMVRHGLDRMAHGLKTGDWPGVGETEDIITYSPPPSVLHWMGEQQLNGKLPNLERI